VTPIDPDSAGATPTAIDSRLHQPLRGWRPQFIVPVMKTPPGARGLVRDRAWVGFDSLPREKQQEVLDFIAFLSTHRARPSARQARKRRPLAAEGFVGMWRNRADLRNSTAWVRRAREEEWGQRRG